MILRNSASANRKRGKKYQIKGPLRCRLHMLTLEESRNTGDTKSRNGGMANGGMVENDPKILKHGRRKITPNPKTRNGCQGMLHKFCTKTPSAWLIFPHDDNACD